MTPIMLTMSPFKQAPPGDPLLPVSIPGGAIFSSEGATFFSGDAVLLSEHGGPEWASHLCLKVTKPNDSSSNFKDASHESKSAKRLRRAYATLEG